MASARHCTSQRPHYKWAHILSSTTHLWIFRLMPYIYVCVRYMLYLPQVNAQKAQQLTWTITCTSKPESMRSSLVRLSTRENLSFRKPKIYPGVSIKIFMWEWRAKVMIFDMRWSKNRARQTTHERSSIAAAARKRVENESQMNQWSSEAWIRLDAGVLTLYGLRLNLRGARDPSLKLTHGTFAACKRST